MSEGGGRAGGCPPPLGPGVRGCCGTGGAERDLPSLPASSPSLLPSLLPSFPLSFPPSSPPSLSPTPAGGHQPLPSASPGLRGAPRGSGGAPCPVCPPSTAQPRRAAPSEPRGCPCPHPRSIASRRFRWDQGGEEVEEGALPCPGAPQWFPGLLGVFGGSRAPSPSLHRASSGAEPSSGCPALGP